MRRSAFSRIALVALPFALLLTSASALEPVHYPPELVLREQIEVCSKPERINTTASMWASSGRAIRAYQLFNFSIEPAAPSKGSRWVAYDCGQKRITTIIEDMNTVCGVKPQDDVSGQHITATMQSGRLLGTGPAPGANSFPGGAVYRLANIEGHGEMTGKLVGRLPEEWGVVAFEQQFLDRSVCGKDEDWGRSGKGGAVLLACNLEQTEYALYRTRFDRLEPLGIKGGPELTSFFIAADRIVFRDTTGKLAQKPIPGHNSDGEKDIKSLSDVFAVRGRPSTVMLYRGNTQDAGSNTLPPANRYGFLPGTGDLFWLNWDRAGRVPTLGGSRPGLLRGVKPLAADLNPRQWGRESSVRPQAHRDIDDFGWKLMDRLGIREGFIVFARRPEGAKADHLYLWCHGTGKVHALGPAVAHEGQPLPNVYQVRVTAGGDVGVLAGDGKRDVFQLYHYPLQKQRTADHYALAMHRIDTKESRKPVRFRMVQNLYALDEVADRGFGSMVCASDGKVYFGTMPHNPRMGAAIFRYGPATDKVAMLGRFDDFAGTKKGSVMNMMHAKPAEVNGRLYWTGQDPFYGKRNFPGWTESNPPYAGSPLVMQDIETGKFTPLGVPFPEEKQNIFVTIGDEKRGVLYVGLGYGGHNGWYELGLEEDGPLSGKKRKLPIESANVALGSDGALYEIRDAKHKKKKTPGGTQIWRYEPASGAAAKVASFTAEALHGKPFALARKNKPVRDRARWLGSSTDGKSLYIYLRGTGIVAAFDVKTRKVRRIGSFAPDDAKYPVYQYDACNMGGGRVWLFHRGIAVRLSTMDLASGKVERFGHLEDDKGRLVDQVTQFVEISGGTVCFGGVVHGHPEDRHWWLREEYKTPWKRVSGFFEIRELLDLL